MRQGRPFAPWALGMLAALLLLALPAAASAVGISLDRTPAPPQAVLRGSTAEQISYQVTFLSQPDRLITSVLGPGGTTPFSQTEDVSGRPSPVARSVAYTPSPVTPVGRYTARVEFYSSVGLENTATTVFDVADQLGTLQLVKWEDADGDGVRDAGEAGLPNWTFRLVNPQGDPSVATTGADGTVTIPSVPAGTWRVEEALPEGWAAITPAGGSVVVPANGTGAFSAGNARPAPISGVVYIDANRNGRRDAGEAPRGGVALELTGTRPGGIGVSARARSGADGGYAFADRLPGVYAVAVRVPGGLSPTTARAIRGIAVTSGGGSAGNDFGLVPEPRGAVAGGPAARPGGAGPGLRIGKSAPPTSRRGTTFSYRILVRNRSESTARNVVVTDPVPAGVTLIALPRRAAIRNGVVTWRLGDLRAGARRAISLRVRVDPRAAARIVNVATVTAEGLAPRRDRVVTRLVGRRPAPRTGGVTG